MDDDDDDWWIMITMLTLMVSVNVVVRSGNNWWSDCRTRGTHQWHRLWAGCSGGEEVSSWCDGTRQDVRCCVSTRRRHHTPRRHVGLCRRQHGQQLKRSSVDPDDLYHFYTTVIRPILEYACPVWHSSLTVEHSNRIEAIQKRAFRIILANFDYLDFCSRNGVLHCTKGDICWPDSFFKVY